MYGERLLESDNNKGNHSGISQGRLTHSEELAAVPVERGERLPQGGGIHHAHPRLLSRPRPRPRRCLPRRRPALLLLLRRRRLLRLRLRLLRGGLRGGLGGLPRAASSQAALALFLPFQSLRSRVSYSLVHLL